MSCYGDMTYILPPIAIMGGETVYLIYNLKNIVEDPIELSELKECTWALKYYSNIYDDSAVRVKTYNSEKQEDIVVDFENGIVTVKINIEDTLGLSGQFVYQTRIVDSSDNQTIKQGLFLINNTDTNIDKIQFIEENRQTLIFEMYEGDGITPIDLSSFKDIRYVLKEWASTNNQPILEKTLLTNPDVSIVEGNKVRVVLQSEDSKGIIKAHSSKLMHYLHVVDENNESYVSSYGFLVFDMKIDTQ